MVLTVQVTGSRPEEGEESRVIIQYGCVRGKPFVVWEPVQMGSVGGWTGRTGKVDPQEDEGCQLWI